jgi:hypothetical protein
MGGYILNGCHVIGQRAGIFSMAVMSLVNGRVYSQWLSCHWSMGGYILNGCHVIGQWAGIFLSRHLLNLALLAPAGK